MAHRAAPGAQHLLCVLCLLFRVSWASTPPFWPEENCLNQVSTHDYKSGKAYGAGQQIFTNMLVPQFGAQSPAVNPYNARFEAYPYAPLPGGTKVGWRMAGPMLNETAKPCMLEAEVGKPMSFTVYAEDMDEGDSVRIYVLEDPGIPNGAFVTADEPHQRCMPKDPDRTVADGQSLGACPMCQSTGAWTYGIEMVPASPDNILAGLAANYTATGQRCTPPTVCPGTSLPMTRRVWCMPASGAAPYGDGKLEQSSQHGRLRKRTFTWTPLPEQGICLHPTHCTYIIKFQAFDSYGMHSVIKEYQIEVIKAAPQYSRGTFGLIIDGAQETFTDPVSSEESHVSSTTYQPQTMTEWMVSERVYKTYINCPMEFAIGVHAKDYDVELDYTSHSMPPGAKIEWRKWTQECEDEQDAKIDVWTDIFGNTCAKYVEEGWCKAGAKGPKYTTVGGSAGYTFETLARDGLLPANKACCACGAGAVVACSARTTQALCEDNSNTAGGKRVYPPQNGCEWDGTACHGTAHPYWVKPGVIESAWSVSETPPRARRVMGIFKWTPVRSCLAPPPFLPLPLPLCPHTRRTSRRARLHGCQACAQVLISQARPGDTQLVVMCRVRAGEWRGAGSTSVSRAVTPCTRRRSRKCAPTCTWQSATTVHASARRSSMSPSSTTSIPTGSGSGTTTSRSLIR